jgi:polyisoprenyl-phosphate glycosyltransferase
MPTEVRADGKAASALPRIDVVVPVFNEGQALGGFHTLITESIAGLHYSFRFLYVNDGSTDSTREVLAKLSATDHRVVPIHLSRNFGHQSALSAGLDACDADAVIMMDGDGEHPPSLIPELVRLYETGYDIVQTRRLDRGRKGILAKRILSAGFYWTMNRLSEIDLTEGSADFRLLSRNAAFALRRLPEYHRFYRGMVQWIGYRSRTLSYVPAKRIAGNPGYSLRKMLRLAADGLFSFSLAPLRLGLWIGFGFVVLVLAEAGYVLSFWLRGNVSSLVPGWSSLILLLTLSSGISMLLVGILGMYIGMIFQEVKRRPVYLLSNSTALTVSASSGIRDCIIVSPNEDESPNE